MEPGTGWGQGRKTGLTIRQDDPIIISKGQAGRSPSQHLPPRLSSHENRYLNKSDGGGGGSDGRCSYLIHQLTKIRQLIIHMHIHHNMDGSGNG